MVRRTDFSPVEDLLELAVDAEQTLENAKTFRPPPLPTAALLPEMAYKPLPLTDPHRRHKLDAKYSKLAAVGEKDAKHEDLEQMFLRVLKKGLEEFAGPRAESSGKNTPPGPRRGAVTRHQVGTGQRSPQSRKQRRRRVRRVTPRHQRVREPRTQNSRDRRSNDTRAVSQGSSPGSARTVRETARGARRWDRSRPQQERFRKAKRA